MKDQSRRKALYMISVAAELTGMHPQTLRVYEQRGLIHPGRSRGNTRLYSQEDIDRINLIAYLTDEGINLTGVTRILDLQEKLEERDCKIETLTQQVEALEHELACMRHEQKVQSLVRYNQSMPITFIHKVVYDDEAEGNNQ